MTNSFFEISYVEDDSPFFQLSNLPVYKLVCSLFEYSDEQIETGIEEIDDKTGSQAYQIAMDLTVNSGNHFFILLKNPKIRNSKFKSGKDIEVLLIGIIINSSK